MTDLESDYLRDMKQEELSRLLKEFDVMIEDTQNNYEDISETTENIFYSELNYNNADVSSGQCILSYDEIKEEIERIKNERL